MGNQPTLRLLLTSVVLAMAGCGQSKGPIVDDPSTAAPQTVTIYELAGLLGLRVSESTPTHVRLKNSANTVMLFTASNGRVYVNAKPVGKIGEIEKTNGKLYVSRTLVSQIRPALHKPATSPLVRVNGKSRRIVIDAGHGGKDPGATSVLGGYEKSINLKVARKVAALLSRRGFKVRMTRSSDRFIELEDRAAIANRLRADLFVSV